MNSKSITIAIIVILILLGGYFLYKNNYPAAPMKSSETTLEETTVPEAMSETLSPTVAPKIAITVSYGVKGFEPATVTIKMGETVQWINDKDSQMWVASAPHPAHTDYPGFDELAGAGKGETYTFTFTKTGSFKYHNHADPKDRGTVAVQ